MKIKDENIIIADEGKVLRRISDQVIFGEKLHLGNTHYLHGELLDEPLAELPEHYEDIDDPEIEEAINDLLKE